MTNEPRSYQATAASDQCRLSERAAAIRRERYKWAEHAMVGMVLIDIAREKPHSHDDHEATLTAVLKLAEHCERAHGLQPRRGKREDSTNA